MDVPRCIRPEIEKVEAAECLLLNGNADRVSIVEMLDAWIALSDLGFAAWAQRADDAATIAIYRSME